LASKRLSSSSLSDLCLQLEPRGKYVSTRRCYRKAGSVHGDTATRARTHATTSTHTRQRRRHHAARIPYNAGTSPSHVRRARLHLPSPRAPPWPRHAPPAPPARGASRRLPAQPSACPHFCLSLSPSRAGHWQRPRRRRGHRDGTRVDARQARAPRAHIYKRKIGPIIGAPPACLGHVSRAAWWLDLHVRRAWHCQGGGSCRYAYGRPSELRGGTREIGMLRQRRANHLDACMRSVHVGARDSDETHA
jgi:hypothetical protein